MHSPQQVVKGVGDRVVPCRGAMVAKPGSPLSSRLRVSLLHLVKSRLIRSLTDAQVAAARVQTQHRFFIASAAYNAAVYVERHLRSIAEQRYPTDKIEHVVLDDASTDSTASVVQGIIEQAGMQHVSIERNETQKGGCANLTRLFRSAPDGAIVLQVDADDWLPDPGVLAYLNYVYQDPAVWMTYNTWQFPDGRPSANSQRIPSRVVRSNSFREYIWISSHLHSFRRELFDQVKDESLIDPETGEYFRSAVDMSHYFPMLELAGAHARHLRRVLYTYNLHSGSIIASKREAQLACERRIREMPRYAPLLRLPSS